jgi:hypothetical protein
MILLLALLPAMAYACVFIYLFNRRESGLVRQQLIRAGLILGGYQVFNLEFLSLIHGVTRTGLVVAWLLPVIIFACYVVRTRKQGREIRLPTIQLPGNSWDWILLTELGSILLITVVVAWITPPQTGDSLTYHMSRVAHWAQNRSIAHYSTGIARQVSMSPGAEMAILNLYVLTGSDRLATFPQWLAMAGSLVCVSLAACYLGAKSSGQWLAATVAAAIPIGIVEASSTINDYVTAFWVVCSVMESLAFYRTNDRGSLVYASLAAALAILTKPTSIPYLIPFAAWLAYLIVKRLGVIQGLRWAAVALVVVVGLNAGYLTRNLITYGNLSNPVDFKLHLNQLRNFQGVTSILLRNAGQHAGLPYLPKVNSAIKYLILAAHYKLGLGLEDPRTTAIGYFNVRPPSTKDTLTTNPYHAYLFLGSFILIPFFWRKIGLLPVFYAVLVSFAFLLYSFVFKWQVFGVRLHLPFFVLASVFLGVVLSLLERVKLGHWVAILLFVGAIPWLFQIDNRPLIPKPGFSEVDSILEESRERLYSVSSFGSYLIYQQITDKIKNEGCKQVGLMLLGYDPEYWIWVLMGAPRDTLHIEWIVGGPTSRYELSSFHPCAVICHNCPKEMKGIRGLPLSEEISGYQLFMTPER